MKPETREFEPLNKALSLLKESVDPRVEETRVWIRSQYPNYPEGIQEIDIGSTEDVVVLYLSDPWDLDIFESVVNEAGYDTEISYDNGHGVVTLFDVEEKGDRFSKRLRGTFHQQQRIQLGKYLVRRNRDVPSYSRLNLVV